MTIAEWWWEYELRMDEADAAERAANPNKPTQRDWAIARQKHREKMSGGTGS